MPQNKQYTAKSFFILLHLPDIIFFAMKTTFITAIAAALCVSAAVSCGRGNSGATGGPDSTGTEYARFLKIADCGDYRIADIVNPWDTLRLLQRYIMVPSSSEMPGNLPEGTVIRTPVDNIIVYSSVHASIIDRLGASDRIAGVCEPEYMTCESVKKGILDGNIIDCGNSFSPNAERIAQAGGQIIIASPFENSNYGTAEKLGIPIIEAADYMENLPLGRTEWVKLFGILLGREDEADSLFRKAEAGYDSIKCKVLRHIDSLGGQSHRPSLLAERKYGASWDVPGGGSYMVRIYRDAGADYIFSGTTSVSNVNMSFENVLKEGSEAEFWVMKYWSQSDMSYRDLLDEYHLYSEFRAFRERRIYGCNTGYSTYYDDIVLSPDLILADLAAIFHPDLFPEYEQVYFKPLKED